MPVLFGRRCVAPILIGLARAYPGLELDLSLNDRLSDLAEDRFDLAVRTGTLADRAGLIARRVARQRMIVVGAPAYLERRGVPATLDDLAAHDALIYRRSGRIPPWLFPQEGGPPREITPSNRLRFDDLGAIADAAETGMGLAWLPSWLVLDRLRAGTLVHLLPDQPPYLYDVHTLWLQTPHLPNKVRLAVDALAAGLPTLME